jgi:hypothetical protein
MGTKNKKKKKKKKKKNNSVHNIVLLLHSHFFHERMKEKIKNVMVQRHAKTQN